MIQKKIEDLTPQVAELLYLINKGHDLVINSHIHLHNGYLIASTSFDGGLTKNHYFFGRIPLPFKRKLKKNVGHNDNVIISDLLSYKHKFGEIIVENRFNIQYINDEIVQVSKGNIFIRDKHDNLNFSLLKLALMFQVESDSVIYPKQLEGVLVEFDRQFKERMDNRFFDCA